MANGGMSTAEIEAGIKGMLNMSFLQKTAEERQISNSKEGELKITIRNEKKGKSRQQQGSKESPPEKSEIESNNSSSKKGNVKRDSKISKKKIKESQSSKVSKTLDEAQPIVEQIDLVTQATQPCDDLKQMGDPRNMTTPQNSFKSEQPKQKKKHTNKNRSGNGPKDSKKETGNVTPASNKKPSLEIYRPKSYKNNATGLQLQTRDDTQDQNPRRGQQSPEPNKTTGQTQKDTPGKSIGKEDQATQEELMDLQEQFIFPLKKKSLKFPKARFFCRICDYHCDTVEISKRHYKDNRHIRLIELKRGDALLKSLPKPCATHIACLDELIDEVYNTQSLGEECVKSRLEYLDALKVYLRQKLPALELEVYGSTVSGFGLKNSDVNVDVVLQQSDNPAYILTTIHEMLRDNENCYDSIQSDFSAKVPCITFRERSSKLSFQICVNNVSAHLTTKLLQLYSNMDPRVKKLGVAFRYWGQLCEIDRQHEGTLPSYSFNLMLVYYLQQCQPPILPSLDQLAAMVPKNMKGNVYTHIFEDDLQMDWTTSNTFSVGELWLGLLEFYSVTYEMTNYIISLRGNNLLRREEKRWNSKKIAIEDPFATKRNITRSVSHSQLYEYIVDRIRATYKYFSIPQTRKGPLFTKVDKTMSKSGPRNKAKKTEAKIEDLVKSDDVVIESDEIIDDNEEIVDTIDRLVTDEDDIERNTHSDVPIADEDLDSLVELIDDTNLNDSVINQHIDTTSIEDTVNSNCTQTINDEELRRFAGNLVINVISGAIATLKSVDDSTSTREAVQQPPTCKTAKKSTTSQGGDNEQLEPFLHLENDEEFIESAVKYGIYRARIVGRLKRSDYAFLFKTETLTDGTGPAIICSICGKEGHLKKMCPDETLPALLPLPVPGKTYMQNLGAALHQLAFETMPTEQDDQRREQILLEIEEFVKELHPDASLSLFGSSCNGFGFRTSDLDICMTLGPKTSEDLDCVDIIEKLATKLRQCKGLYQVVPITTAKVPIVKFKHRRSQLEGDISLYNTLAQHNTDMLRMYSEIDSRVRILGYCLKHFAKICDIGDASRGSLSSYAYILMLLYFLQQRKPAVIPVLQEMYEGPDKPETLVDGWNAWFCPDGNLLTKLWPDCGKNKESVAELWIGFLRFYTEVFNFKDYVISIRSIKPLSCLEKLWNGKCIAIEDPFDLNHNLGAGVSRKMNTFIQKAFIKGRHIFGIPVDTLPRNYSNLLDYLFDPKLLTDGAPPNDRGCRICSKIGHFAKDCPVVQNRKERAARQREQREQWEHKQQEGGESPGKSRDNWRDNRPDRPRDSDNRNWRDKQGTEARPIPKTGNHGSQSPASTPSRGERTYYGSSSGQSPVPKFKQVFFNKSKGGSQAKPASPQNKGKGKQNTPSQQANKASSASPNNKQGPVNHQAYQGQASHQSKPSSATHRDKQHSSRGKSTTPKAKAKTSKDNSRTISQDP
ncbi:unnamed protein product [Owenia fusiformis]|uniref:CCHC-type domain-containing protein n=1 Tax=Owenia fusiformis TaxID=6347 RepID=A0A8J1XZP5_OWEFU|nr:unnamed protein product [Owenia fusiformis]